MKNKDVQNLSGFLKQLVAFLTSKEYRELIGLFWEATKLFQEAVPILKQILETQKEILDNQKNHTQD
jgi:hypothetical protein